MGFSLLVAAAAALWTMLLHRFPPGIASSAVVVKTAAGMAAGGAGQNVRLTDSEGVQENAFRIDSSPKRRTNILQMLWPEEDTICSRHFYGIVRDQTTFQVLVSVGPTTFQANQTHQPFFQTSRRSTCCKRSRSHSRTRSTSTSRRETGGRGRREDRAWAAASSRPASASGAAPTS